MRARKRLSIASALLGAMLLIGTAAAAEDEAPVSEQSTSEEDTKDVRLDVQVLERGPFRPWRLKVTNVSDEPVRIAADPRLLSFEVVIPDKDKPVHCKLPDSMMPDSVAERSLRILEPGKFAVRRFDPRFFCFSEGPQETLVPGAELTPTFGFPTKTKTKWRRGRKIEEPLPPAPPWAAEPVLEDTELSPIQNAQGAPITLSPDYAIWGEPEEEENEDPLTLSISRGVDASNERNIIVTVVLKNTSKERQRVFFRRELVTFEVLGPEGLVECQAGPDARNPMPTAFSNMSPGSRRTRASRVVELCPRGTFARPGLYLLSARLEAQVDGDEHGLDVFTGTLRTKRPVTVRVRKGIEPFLIRRPRAPGGKPVTGTGAPTPAPRGGPRGGDSAPEAPAGGDRSAPPPAPAPPSGDDGREGTSPPPRRRHPVKPPIMKLG